MSRGNRLSAEDRNEIRTALVDRLAVELAMIGAFDSVDSLVEEANGNLLLPDTAVILLESWDGTLSGLARIFRASFQLCDHFVNQEYIEREEFLEEAQKIARVIGSR